MKERRESCRGGDVSREILPLENHGFFTDRGFGGENGMYIQNYGKDEGVEQNPLILQF